MSRKKKQIVREDWPRVRRVTVRGQERFIVDGRPHKERKFFKNEQDAEVQADVWARERTNQGIEGLSFPTELRIEAIKARKRLDEYGKKIGDAVDHYVRWLDEERQKRAALLVDSCLDQWIKSKEAEFTAGHLRPTTLQELRSRSKFLRATFGRQRITEIDEHSIQNFLDSLPYTPRAKLNVRTKFCQFLNYCRRRKWIRENPAEAIRVRVSNGDVQILRPRDSEQLLVAAQQAETTTALSVIPYLAVSLFGGLRPGEAEQLRWEYIHFDTREIEVLAKTSKTKETRFVKMEDALIDWLLPFRKRRGLIVGQNFQKRLKAVKSEAGYGVSGKKGKPWPKDVLRHTFGTYWLARHEDRARLAEQMGNTIEVIKKHYRRAVPKAETDKFWALRPQGRGKIVPMPVIARGC
jgi:integrase